MSYEYNGTFYHSNNEMRRIVRGWFGGYSVSETIQSKFSNGDSRIVNIQIHSLDNKNFYGSVTINYETKTISAWLSPQMSPLIHSIIKAHILDGNVDSAEDESTIEFKLDQARLEMMERESKEE